MAQRDGAFNPPPPADRMARRPRKKKQRVPRLPDDLIVEILSRVPYRSLCRFRCVSRSWLALCSDPDLRKRSPQTLSGFFCYSRHEDDDYNNYYCPHLLNLSGRGRPLVDPSPPFLEGCATPPLFVQCCSSLLLWKFCKLPPLEAEYVVSNPATQKWILLPRTEARHPGHFVRLGFDPAVPSCFYVFIFVTRPDLVVAGVEIYSSETGRWIFRQSEWGNNTRAKDDADTVFFNGTLYSTDSNLSVITIDAQGKTWREIPKPCSRIQPGLVSFMAHSQNRLYVMHIDHIDSCKNNRLSVRALEANGNDQWILEHTASITRLLGRRHHGKDEFYILMAAHPECNLVFFAGGVRDELISYDMDDREVRVICTLQEYFLAPCFPYIPCFAEWSSPHDKIWCS